MSWTSSDRLWCDEQNDLAELVWGTACRNGWGDRSTVYNNAVTTDSDEAGDEVQLGNKDVKEGGGVWGFRPDGAHLASE
jgi:hypothetical protein